MYKVYSDGSLLYDPRVKELEIFDPRLDLEVNRSGSFKFTMYNTHPLYGTIRKLKSVIEVHQDSALLFRGRPINDDIDTYNGITYECEGDLAAFNDSLVRPYTFQGSITGYLDKLITDHNAQVEVGKQFTLGNVTVTDPNDYIIRGSSDYPTTWQEIEDKLLDILGGYILVRRSGGVNYIDYLEDSSYMSLQKIELGENLLKLSQERRGEDIATAIIPLGVKDEETGERLTIESVNDGLDYVHDPDTVDKYGWIYKTVVFDDVTLPSNLLTRANQALARSILQLNTIELSAVDLSMMDADIDDFKLFEYVQVVSPIHGIDDLYLIRRMTIDLMRPDNNTITIGAQFASFTEKQYNSAKVVEKVIREVAENGQSYANDLVNNVTIELNSVIQQEAADIRTEVSETYTSKNELETYRQEISTEFEQTKDTFNYQWDQLTQIINNNQDGNDTEFELIRRYIRFENGKIILGESTNPVTLTIENNRIYMAVAGVIVSYWEVDESGANPPKFYVTDGEFLNSLRLGNFAFTPRSNGNLSFGKVV